MRPYPLETPGCGPCNHNCNQGRLCSALHRVQLTPAQVTDAEYDEEVSTYGKGAGWFALGLVALIGLAVSMDSLSSYVVNQWPRLVAMLSGVFA